MKYSFNAYGHENILGTHQTTIEFTKDKDLTLKGTCIIGVRADFDLSQLKKGIGKKAIGKIIIKIKTTNLQEEVIADINPKFNDDKEMVIRKSNFLDKRTFAVNANKSAFDLDRGLIDKLKDKNVKIKVELYSV